MLVPTRILVPTDFSESSGRALGQALDIANEYQAKVFLLHVVHEVMDLTGLDFINTKRMIQDFKSNELVWAKRNLQKQLEVFPQANDVDVEMIVRQGVPYVEIMKVGEEERIDLIVIPSLGKTGIKKYLIGSVARNVLKSSKCPVLLTK